MKLAFTAISIAACSPAFAGGLLTNTNQHIAFNRMMSREASIGIDGVYYNPAGVAFMDDGTYFSINWQTVAQTRTIENEYTLFNNNTNNPTAQRQFKGKAFAPVLPSFQFAYNKNNLSLQANFAVAGGGGKCKFDDGLGSFEKIVSETAMGAVGLANAIDGTINQALQTTGMQIFTNDAMFGTKGTYSFNSYMRGRQYYFGLSVGAAYKLNSNWSVYGGLRTVYASCNYYGYVKDIKVGNMPLYQVLDPSKSNSADIELNCDQNGWGFTPIIAIDYKLRHWNFSAKYEFKTRMRLKNESVNRTPSIGNLPANLASAFSANGFDEKTSAAILNSKNVTDAMVSLKTQFDQKLDEAIGEYADGKSIACDIPALLTLGVGYSPIDPLRINVGYHYFWDKQATAYNNKNEKLSRGTIELNAGVEYDASKLVTVSAGWQNTNYGLTREYMEDKSFVTSSNSIGAGVCLHLTNKLDLNLAYFTTLYGHEKTSEESTLGTTKLSYNSDYTRTNHVFGVGVDFKF